MRKHWEAGGLLLLLAVEKLRLHDAPEVIPLIFDLQRDLVARCIQFGAIDDDIGLLQTRFRQ